MKAHPNQELFDLIQKHDLSKARVAELCCCGRTSVYSWTREPDHKDFFPMSRANLQLLRLELREVKPATHWKRRPQ